MVEHEDIRQLISLYFDGEASPEETQVVKVHINECEDCAQYFQDLFKLSNSLKSWNNESLSPDFEQKINQSFLKLKQEEQKMKNKTPLFKAGVGGGALVALILTVLVTHNYTKQSLESRIEQEAQMVRIQPQVVSKVIAQKGAVLDKVSNDKHHVVRMQEKKLKVVERNISDELAQVAEVSAASSNQSSLMGFAQSMPAKFEGRNQMLAQADQSATAPGAMPIRKLANMGMKVEQMISYDRPDIAIWPSPTPHPYIPTQPGEKYNREQYDRIYENQFLSVTDNPLSTFSIDVDTASYSNIRRFLNNNQMPPEDAVRIEEMVNYFSYDYPKPEGKDPFSITTKASVCPWNPKHKLALIGLQGKTLSEKEIPESNLVFLIDVSGSMNQPNKLPLLKNAYKMMVNQLTDKQRVAIVVYAGAAGTVLESTSGDNKYKILQAIDNLQAGGSTAGGAGIQLAYNIAKENFVKGGNNRVILATDGDFNIGVSSNAEMIRLIEAKRKEGVFLTVLGFGMGNYQDSRLEQIANKGNGNYYYIDTDKEAKKVLVNELGSTLFTIAKDVKIQIEFNPAQVKAYRLIGYENRILAKEDFNDDSKDAGELGAGHSVTALYEIVTTDSEEEFGNVDELVYQQKKVISSNDLMTVKLRYKNPDEDKSKLIKKTVAQRDIVEEPKGDFQFAAGVAEFGLLLRNSKFKENAAYDHVIKSAESAKGKDSFGYRQEFIDLVKKAQTLDNRPQKQGIIFKGE